MRVNESYGSYEELSPPIIPTHPKTPIIPTLRIFWKRGTILLCQLNNYARHATNLRNVKM